MSFHVTPDRTGLAITPSNPFSVKHLTRRMSRSGSLALVLSIAFAGSWARAQEPDVWPQDDDYGSQPSDTPQDQVYNVPQYTQPQASYPQQSGYGYPQQGQQAYNDPQYGQSQYAAAGAEAQPLSAQQLEQLVAPIALYPDAVLAQILAASTYPAQVASADQWLRTAGGASPEQVAAAVNAQNGWDPSVKALTAYPQVLSMMDQNLQWTTALGNAYYNQPQDLLQTVQVLRQRAQASGTLQSTPQEQVVQDQGYIALQPTNPEVVYVPTYNPWAVYGAPIAPYPMYRPLDTVGEVVGTAIDYGLSFAVSAFIRAPFGLLSWGLDWLANAVLFDHGVWCSHSYEVRDWGFRYGGPRAFYGHEFARYGRGADPYRGWHGGGMQRGWNRPNARFPLGRGQENAFRGQSGFNRGGNFAGNRPGQFSGGLGNGYSRGGQTLGRPFSGGNGGLNRGALPLNRPGQTFAGGPGGLNRGGSYPGMRPSAPSQLSYNHMPAPLSRPQQFGGAGTGGYRSPGYSSFAQRPGAPSGFSSGMAQRPFQSPAGHGYSYGSPSSGYRSPSQSFSHQSFGGGNYASNYGGSHSSGGIHLFGGDHSSPGYGGGGRSFGGGSSHAFSGGGRSFSGGGHSFGGGGGGHSFGGGHSGGHSSGGHSGGHGHH